MIEYDEELGGTFAMAKEAAGHDGDEPIDELVSDDELDEE